MCGKAAAPLALESFYVSTSPYGLGYALRVAAPLALHCAGIPVAVLSNKLQFPPVNKAHAPSCFEVQVRAFKSPTKVKTLKKVKILKKVKTLKHKEQKDQQATQKRIKHSAAFRVLFLIGGGILRRPKGTLIPRACRCQEPCRPEYSIVRGRRR
ncbi:MAG: hypothetical protein JWO13_1011 [Acidobacteriales bacterium]|nr:hypothetical protein [Terriglobales bacterium]